MAAKTQPTYRNLLKKAMSGGMENTDNAVAILVV